MTEYIEREAAFAFMNEVEPCICHNPDGVVFTATKDNDMLEFLRAIPAADVVPVVRGKWVNYGDEYRPDIRCCMCGQRKPILLGNFNFNYCHNCGAKMEMVTDCNQVKDGDGNV